MKNKNKLIFRTIGELKAFLEEGYHEVEEHWDITIFKDDKTSYSAHEWSIQPENNYIRLFSQNTQGHHSIFKEKDILLILIELWEPTTIDKVVEIQKLNLIIEEKVKLLEKLKVSSKEREDEIIAHSKEETLLKEHYQHLYNQLYLEKITY